MDSDLETLLRRLIREELIGSKGDVKYYQMGGSIERPELYNLDSKGKPTRDPGVPGLKKSKKKRKK